MDTWATAGGSGGAAGPAGPERGGDYDLLLDLAGRRSRAALEDALREAVRDGRLAPGTRLPSSRVLAGDLGLARNTVADAYGQLVAEGWLTARQGSGTAVAPRPAAGVPVAAAPHPPGPPYPPGATAAYTDLVPHSPTARLPYVLRPGSPDLSSFPRAAWRRAARRALTAAPSEAFGYADPRGPARAAHRARRLPRPGPRRARPSPERIVICTGFVQAVGLLGRALRGRGARRIAVEEAGLPDTPHAAAGRGPRTGAAAGRRRTAPTSSGLGRASARCC